MPEDVFRIVVAVAVGMAALAFVIQACVVFAIYRSSKRTEERVTQFIGEVQPVVGKVGPTLDHASDVMQHLNPVIDRIGPVIDQLGPVLAKAGPSVERIGPAADKIGQLVDKFGMTLASANRIMDETRPKINEITVETLAIAKTGREQVERLGGLLTDAGERARARLEQIDHTVESTVEQVEQVGGTVRRAVMKPVKEVNGLAAGISAAVSTLVHGSRKSSVDSATQDEEMFI